MERILGFLVIVGAIVLSGFLALYTYNHSTGFLVTGPLAPVSLSRSDRMRWQLYLNAQPMGGFKTLADCTEAQKQIPGSACADQKTVGQRR